MVWVDRVRLLVEEVPDNAVDSLAVDFFQQDTWYAGSGETLFRSLDNGEGWEAVGRFPGEKITEVRTSPDRAGLLSVVTASPAGTGSQIYISTNCGEAWETTPLHTDFKINDIAWILRETTPVLFLATDKGLYELTLAPGSSPLPVLVDPHSQGLSFYAVATARDARGQVSVTIAAQNNQGVFLSSEGGQPNTFRNIGLQGEDIRTLAVNYDGPRAFLWAGATAAGGDDPGHGCFRWELRGSENPPEGWKAFNQGWNGQSCLALAFIGMRVVAASYRMGVLTLDLTAPTPQWKAPDVECGLPLRDPARFHPVETVAVDPQGRWVMAGSEVGVYRSADVGVNYAAVSQKDFPEMVTLPPTWLFCSGEHDVNVVSEDEAH